MSEQIKYEVGGKIQDARGKWHEIVSVGSEMPFIDNNGENALIGMPPNFIRDYRPPSSPIRQHRKAKPGEVWETRLGSVALKTRNQFVYLESREVVPFMEDGADLTEESGNTFIARSLEEYYRDGYVKIEDVRRAVLELTVITLDISDEGTFEVLRADTIFRRLAELGIKKGEIKRKEQE